MFYAREFCLILKTVANFFAQKKLFSGSFCIVLHALMCGFSPLSHPFQFGPTYVKIALRCMSPTLIIYIALTLLMIIPFYYSGKIYLPFLKRQY